MIESIFCFVRPDVYNFPKREEIRKQIRVLAVSCFIYYCVFFCDPGGFGRFSLGNVILVAGGHGRGRVRRPYSVRDQEWRACEMKNPSFRRWETVLTRSERKLLAGTQTEDLFSKLTGKVRRTSFGAPETEPRTLALALQRCTNVFPFCCGNPKNGI